MSPDAPAGADVASGGGRAVYPGTFNPVTVAHLAVAEAAREQAGLDRVEFVISHRALGKEHLARPTVDERVEVLRRVAATRPWLSARATGELLIADIASGADALVLGADKWAQILDPRWYGGSVEARDAAMGRLPLVLIAPRPPHALPTPVPDRLRLLVVHPAHAEVSSTAVRSGHHAWMVPEARASGLWTPCGDGAVVPEPGVRDPRGGRE